MRLLFVTPYYYPELKFGGPPQKMHTLARGFSARGHDVRVLTFHSEHPRRNRQDNLDGVCVQYLPWLGRSLRQWPLGVGLIKSSVAAADLVHWYGLYDFLGPKAITQCRRLSRPFVMEPLGMYVPRGRSLWPKRVYHRFFTRRFAKLAAALIAASESERDDLTGLVPPERLIVRRNGIEVATFSRLPEREICRQRLGIKPGEKLILYLGRLSPIKNLPQFISAFARLKEDGVRLLIAGPANEPDYAATLRSQVDKLGLDSKVSFPGSLFGDDKLSALAAADLFVLPSISESFGNAAGEAVAAGVPVLLTNTCGIAPLIHRRAGLAVPLGEEPLAAGLRTMLDQSSCYELTSRRAEVVAALSWDDPIRQTEQLYQQVLSRVSPV